MSLSAQVWIQVCVVSQQWFQPFFLNEWMNETPTHSHSDNLDPLSAASCCFLSEVAERADALKTGAAVCLHVSPVSPFQRSSLRANCTRTTKQLKSFIAAESLSALRGRKRASVLSVRALRGVLINCCQMCGEQMKWEAAVCSTLSKEMSLTEGFSTL